MTTVADTTPTRKPRAFYGWLETEHGMFVKPQDVVLFVSSATGELRVVETGMNWTFNGDVALSDAQAMLDRVQARVAARQARCPGCGLVGCRGEAGCRDQMALPLVAA